MEWLDFFSSRQALESLLRKEGVWQTVALVFAFSIFLHRARSASLWKQSLLALPGVFLHEVMHLIVGIVFCASPASFSVIPRRDGDRYLLGSVTFRSANLINSVFVGMAPILLLPVAGWIFFHWAVPAWLQADYLQWVFIGYLTASITQSSVPSAQDFRMSLASICFYCLLGGGVWWLYRETPAFLAGLSSFQ